MTWPNPTYLRALVPEIVVARREYSILGRDLDETMGRDDVSPVFSDRTAGGSLYVEHGIRTMGSIELPYTACRSRQSMLYGIEP